MGNLSSLMQTMNGESQVYMKIIISIMIIMIAMMIILIFYIAQVLEKYRFRSIIVLKNIMIQLLRKNAKYTNERTNERYMHKVTVL